jgi:hypothetical protein
VNAHAQDNIAIPYSIGLKNGSIFRSDAVADNPQKLRQFRDIEADLQRLDHVSWAYLTEKVAPLHFVKHRTRRWAQFFNQLNEAKAYSYLVRSGCFDIHFIPESKIRGQHTPDVEAIAQGQRVLCEVKTINASDVEAARFHNNGVGEIQVHLPDSFLKKSDSHLNKAVLQMHNYCAAVSTMRLASGVRSGRDRQAPCHLVR